jgi:hypothetical protein
MVQNLGARSCTMLAQGCKRIVPFSIFSMSKLAKENIQGKKPEFFGKNTLVSPEKA